MQMTLVRAGLLAASVGIGFAAGAQATTDSTHADATASPANAPALTMPSEVIGYRLTDSVRLGSNTGTQYTYVRGKHDKIDVLVSPYEAAAPLRTTQDTVAMLESAVDGLRLSLDAQYRKGDLSAFQSLREHTDDFKTAGRTVRGYMLLAALTHRGAVVTQFGSQLTCAPEEAAQHMGACPARSGRAQSSDMPATNVSTADVRGFEAFTYYGVYALAQSVVRIKAQMPEQVAANEQASAFSRNFVTAILAGH